MAELKSRKQIFFRAHVDKLRSAIDLVAKSKSQIAVKGDLNRETLNKALKGERIAESKANAICKGLNHFGCFPLATKDSYFFEDK